MEPEALECVRNSIRKGNARDAEWWLANYLPHKYSVRSIVSKEDVEGRSIIDMLREAEEAELKRRECIHVSKGADEEEEAEADTKEATA